MVRLTPRPFYVQDRAPKYPFCRMVRGLQAQFRRFGEGKKSFRPAESEPRSFCLLSNHSTDCLIPTPVFCKAENFMYIFKLLWTIKPIISTAYLIQEIETSLGCGQIFFA